MQIKISKMALLTMPCFVALSLAACGGSSSHSNSDNFDPVAPSKFSSGSATPTSPTGLTAPTGDVVKEVDGYVVLQWLDDEYGTRGSKDPSGLSLHLWEDEGCDAKIVSTNNDDWNNKTIIPTDKNDYGPYWKLEINDYSVSGCMNIIVRDENLNKLYDGDQKISWTADDHSVTLSNKQAESYASTEEAFNAKYSVSFDVEDASAHWLAKNILVWKNAENYHVRLQFAPDPISVSDNALTGSFINLTATTLSDEMKAAHPNLAEFKAFEVPADAQLDDAKIKQLLKGEALLVGLDGNNEVVAKTRIQTASVIDELYVSPSLLSSELGAKVTDPGVSFKVWAPTAKSVKVHIWPKAGDDSWDDKGGEMTEDPATGVWSYNADGLTADGKAAYKYELEVYHPATRKIENTWATDPYSLSILWDNDGNVSSAVVDLNRDEAKPKDWDNVKAPHPQATEADISAMLITESHIRDLTVGTDKGVSAENQGKYKGLSELNSNVGKHLKGLSEAGVTHIEFLPLYDIASINEKNVFDNKTLDVTLTGADFCSRASVTLGKSVTSTEGVDVCNSNELVYDLLAQAAASDSIDDHKVDTFLKTYVKDQDSYNWGYDPWHYQVPEGSYASDIKNPYTRIKEIREMFKTVKSDYGMNVVMDVVYNHTDGAGVDKDSSVLDRIVPWYYNRLNPVSGSVIHDTCCEDTAGEHKMFAKLMEDTLVTWAKDYKVDVFRFDLMGYLPKQVMVDTLAHVKTRSGNSEMYFLGEGWDAGSAAAALGNENNATQINMHGTGIGTFNDRIRDGVRGSGPFDHGDWVKKQGFATGRCSDTVLVADGDAGCDAEAKNYQDIIRISMAGNLKDYELETYDGTIKKGSEIMYGDAIAGYGDKPIDTINYVSKHDNQTLFDMIMYKAKKERTMEEKVKMQAIGLATALLGQSPAFDQQGSDLLRTKYFQNDSYNTGDFSNKVNYDSAKGNEFIPRALVNKDKDYNDDVKISDWPVMVEVGEYNSDVGAELKAKMTDTYKAMATIRKNNDALHLGDAELIKSNVKFLNTGADQKKGLIVMHAANKPSGKGAKDVVVMLNAIPGATEFDVDANMSGLSAADTGALFSGACSVDGTKIKAAAWSVCVFIR